MDDSADWMSVQREANFARDCGELFGELDDVGVSNVLDDASLVSNVDILDVSPALGSAVAEPEDAGEDVAFAGFLPEGLFHCEGLFAIDILQCGPEVEIGAPPAEGRAIGNLRDGGGLLVGHPLLDRAQEQLSALFFTEGALALRHNPIIAAALLAGK